MAAAANAHGGDSLQRFSLEKHGWKVGDQITIKGGMPRKDGGQDWTYQIVGIMRYTGDVGKCRQMLAGTTLIWMSRVPRARGTMNRFLMRIKDACCSQDASREIDGAVRQLRGADPNAVRVGSSQSALAQIGDFKFFTARSSAPCSSHCCS